MLDPSDSTNFMYLFWRSLLCTIHNMAWRVIMLVLFNKPISRRVVNRSKGHVIRSSLALPIPYFPVEIVHKDYGICVVSEHVLKNKTCLCNFSLFKKCLKTFITLDNIPSQRNFSLLRSSESSASLISSRKELSL